MVRLLVIADDFTGALDTGVQFRAKDSFVLVYKEGEKDLVESLKKDVQVLIVDAETRHLDAGRAFDIISSIVDTAVRMGVSYIYKKTDSGMRGNIGSELAAFLFASKGKHIHFIPAFPKMGRTTLNGIHYIDGIPVSESVFGADLYEPVRRSAVKDIIAEQSDVKVYEMGKHAAACSLEGILVYDGTSEDEMYQLATELKEKDELHLLAGCAGFAGILFGMIGLEAQENQIPRLHDGLLTICGSINMVTVRQLDHAAEAGMYRIFLSPEQKLQKGWSGSESGKACITKWQEDIRRHKDAIIECGVHDMENTREYIRESNLAPSEVRERIADAMGSVLKGLLDAGIKKTILVTGGDTLQAFMKQIHQNRLVPICEILSGVVLSRFEYHGGSYDLISKSGGFGHEELLVDMARLIRQKY